MTRWVTLLPLAAIVALALLFGIYGLHHNPHVEPHELVGKPMPDDALPSLDDGRQVKLRELVKDGPVVVNFFASWCGPCQVEEPTLMALKAKKVPIVGIAYEDEPQNTQAFLNRLGDPFAVRLVDRHGRTGVDFGITGVPETYLVGADGVIKKKWTGPLDDGDVEALARAASTAR